MNGAEKCIAIVTIAIFSCFLVKYAGPLALWVPVLCIPAVAFAPAEHD